MKQHPLGCKCRVDHCKFGPPRPPLMRVGSKGETWDPATGQRIPPPTVEYRHVRRADVKEGLTRLLMFLSVLAAGFIIGFLTRGGV